MKFVKRRTVSRDEVASSSMTELITFFLFHCLVLLGAVAVFSGAQQDGQGNVIQELQAESSKKDFEIAGLKGELLALNIVILGFREGEAKLRLAIDILRGRFDRLNREREKGEAEVARLEKGLLELRILIGGFRNNETKLQKKIYDFENLVWSLQVELKTKSAEIEVLKKSLRDIQDSFGLQEQQLVEARDALATAERGSTKCKGDQCEKGHDEPIVLVLTEGDGYTFLTGSSRIDTTFAMKFEAEDFGRLSNDLARLRKQGFAIAGIDVIGHTDEDLYEVCDPNLDKSCAVKVCRFDEHVLGSLNNEFSDKDLWGCDNSSLGLARAVSTTRYLKGLFAREHPELSEIPILPLSAGFLHLIGGEANPKTAPSNIDDDNRRRIEIRVRTRAIQ